MIKSVEFLKNELEKLSNKFKNALIRYEYIDKTNLHLIEVKPYDLYDNREYLEAEEEIEKSFEDKFPDERFLYLGEFPLFEINNVTAEFGYEPEIRITNYSVLSESLKVGFDNNHVEYEEIKSSFFEIQLSNIHLNISNNISPNYLNNKIIVENKGDFHMSENNYALAA